MSPAEQKPPSWQQSKGWYDTLMSGTGTLDGMPTLFEDRAAKHTSRWIGWRLRGLVLAALGACLLLFGLIQALANSPRIDAQWAADGKGRVLLVSSALPELRGAIGQALTGVVTPDGRGYAVSDTSLLQRGPRWIIDPTLRQRLLDAQAIVNSGLGQGQVWLSFADGQRVAVQASERGITGLGWAFWPVAALALTLFLVGAVLWLARPDWRNAFYLTVTVCQAINLLYIAIGTLPGVPLPDAVVRHEMAVRLTLDLISAAATLHVFTLPPHRPTYGPLVAIVGWVAALGPIVALLLQPASGSWWWAQGTVVALGLLSVGVLSQSYAAAPHPVTAIMRRLSAVVVGSLMLLLAALMATQSTVPAQLRVAEIGSALWTVFFATVLVLIPFLTRSRQLLREFALLAGISTVATSLDLLFVALFSLGQFASVALAVFLSLGAYAVAREWMVNHLTGSHAVTLERIFERLYRVAREIEVHPERRLALMEHFLRELFDPLESEMVERRLSHSRVASDGSALMIPAPRDGQTVFDGMLGANQAWLLRHARRGKRLFTAEDARLADRVCEQLRRAVVYDKAVERGRNEERRRIAQDLHDDIGARLLTMMYKAESPELEDYVRHTLQDLKTLTRGLAASEHQLSHAVGEWKADINQRLQAAQITLGWSFTYDQDLALSVTQWSGLTRILRELVSNAIYHAQATHLEIDASLFGGRLSLWVADNGKGRDPARWSHGLGLGGVRKRVKALGGVVRWRENQPKGIICEVQIDRLDLPPPALRGS